MTNRAGRIVGALLATALIAGCGSQYREQSQLIRALGQTLAPNLGTSGQNSADATGMGGLSREALDAAGGEYMLAAIPSRNSAAVVQRVGENRGENTWISPDGISVTFESGVLVATRGLGPDLMAAEVSGIVAALRQGGGESRRTHEYLDGNDQIVRQIYDCRVTPAGAERITAFDRVYATVKYEENCALGAQRFQNIYWIDSTGVVRKSRQLISPPVGYLDSERL